MPYDTNQKGKSIFETCHIEINQACASDFEKICTSKIHNKITKVRLCYNFF